MPQPYIVRLRAPLAEFRTQLATIPGARFLRELTPGQAVVTLPPDTARAALQALPAVETATPDRLEHPHQ